LSNIYFQTHKVINPIEVMIKKVIFKICQFIIRKFKRDLNEFYLNDIISKLKVAGSNLRLGDECSFKNANYISIGSNFSALERFRIEAWDEYQGEIFSPEIIIGKNVCFNTDIHIGCINKVLIGDFCLFGSRIYITDHDHGSTNIDEILIPPIHRKLFSKGPVKISNNVYVGEGVSILSGVTIGEIQL